MGIYIFIYIERDVLRVTCALYILNLGFLKDDQKLKSSKLLKVHILGCPPGQDASPHQDYDILIYFMGWGSLYINNLHLPPGRGDLLDNPIHISQEFTFSFT